MNEFPQKTDISISKNIVNQQKKLHQKIRSHISNEIAIVFLNKEN